MKRRDFINGFFRTTIAGILGLLVISLAGRNKLTGDPSCGDDQTCKNCISGRDCQLEKAKKFRQNEKR